MRVLLWLIAGLSACGSHKSPCDTVKLRIDTSTIVEIPARAEYCVYTPDPTGCCRDEGTDCAALASSSHVFAIERPPGCDPAR
jgi:hypothetical protein